MQVTNHLYDIGAAMSGHTFYVISQGACTGPVTTANYDLYALPQEVLPSQLVQQTLTALPGARLVQQIYAGSDGSELRGPVVDTMLDTTCTPGTDPAVCVPLVGGAGSFLDSTCTTSVVTAQTSCPTPKYGAQPAKPGCFEAHNAYYTVGAASLNANFYDISNGTCTSFAPDDASHYFNLDTQVDAQSVTTRLGETSGQIARQYLTDGTSNVGALGLYDTTHAIACTTIGGVCLPSAGSTSGGYFSDAGCTMPAQYAQVYLGNVPGCEVPPVPKYFLTTNPLIGTQCNSTYGVAAAGARAAKVYAMNGTDCQLVDQTTTAYFSVGASVALGEFATATSGMDP